jgi:hypothetical protein
MILLARGLIKSVFKTYIFIIIFFNGNIKKKEKKKKEEKAQDVHYIWAEKGGPPIRWVDDQVGFASGLELQSAIITTN